MSELAEGSAWGGKRTPERGKKLGRRPSTINGILAALPGKRRDAFFRSVQIAVAKTVKIILKGETPDSRKEIARIAADAHSVKQREASGAKAVELAEQVPISVGKSGRGGRRTPGPGKFLGVPPFTVEGICARYPQCAERLRLDITRLAQEEVARRLGVHVAKMPPRARAAHNASTSIDKPRFPLATEAKEAVPRMPGWGGRRTPGPGKRLGRPPSVGPGNPPLYMRALRGELGVRELGDLTVRIPVAELAEQRAKLNAKLQEAERILAQRTPEEMAEAAKITAAAGLRIRGVKKYQMALLLFPEQNVKKLAVTNTKQFFRRKKDQIDIEESRLSGLTEPDREAAIDTALSYLARQANPSQS